MQSSILTLLVPAATSASPAEEVKQALPPLPEGKVVNAFQQVMDGYKEKTQAIQDAMDNGVAAITLSNPITPMLLTAVGSDFSGMDVVSGADPVLAPSAPVFSSLPETPTEKPADLLAALLLKPVNELTKEDLSALATMTGTTPELAVVLPEIVRAKSADPSVLPTYNVMELLTAAEGRLVARLAPGSEEDKSDDPSRMAVGLKEVIAELLGGTLSPQNNEAVQTAGDAQIPNASQVPNAQQIAGAPQIPNSPLSLKSPSKNEFLLGGETDSDTATTVTEVLSGVLGAGNAAISEAAVVAAVLPAASFAAAASASSQEEGKGSATPLPQPVQNRAGFGLADASEKPSKNLPFIGSASARPDKDADAFKAANKPEVFASVLHHAQEEVPVKADNATAPSAVAAVQEATRALAAHSTQPLRVVQQAHGHPPLTEQIVVNIKSAVKDGVSQIQIKLEPAELGKVEVKMDVASDGRTGVVVTVDNKDTLDLLQRDARSLERALNDLGLKTGSGDLSFNLRGGEGQGDGRQFSGQRGGYTVVQPEADDPVSQLLAPLGNEYSLTLTPGVNIQV